MKINRILCVTAIALACASCGKQSTSSFAAPSAPGGVRTKSALNDYSKPYLTDDKVQKLINSMQEGKNPFDFLFGKSGGAAASLANLATAGPQLDAFSRKYGFVGYEDYMAVWGRIAAGEATMMAEDMLKGARQSMQESIQNAQEELKKPNLSPEMRKMYEEQVAGTQKSLDEMNKPDSGSTLNEADLELYKKYKEQITAAEKKYNTQK